MSMTSNRVISPGVNRSYQRSEIPAIRYNNLIKPMGYHFITPSGAKVPPGWSNVWIASDSKSPLQATGRDSKGRRVYLYSAEHMGAAAAAKFSRLKAFGRAYLSLMNKIRRDMNYSEDALVLYLIAKTGFRIGGNSETFAAVKAFGASTLQCSHVGVEGHILSFDFIGKKGVRVRKLLKDKYLAQVITGRCGGSFDPKIFRTTDRSIRTYLNSISNGSVFTVKDFRTYLATLTAFRKIKKMPVPGSEQEFKRYRKEVGQTVAGELGNSTAVALNSYIAPEVFCPWNSASDSMAMQVKKTRTYLNADFLECIHYAQKVKI
jgi:DNA topoisomerase-1